MVRHTGEDFIDVEGIAITSVLAFQSASINGSKLDAPETDRLTRYSDTTFGEKVFDISMAEIEAIVKPHSMADDIGRESVSFICIHGPIVTIRVI